MLGACLVVLALLAGCGGGGRAKRSTVTAPGAASQAPLANSPSTPVTKPGPTTLGSFWPYAQLVASLSGRTLVLPGGPVRLDGSLLVCNWRGASLGGGRARRWRRFTCTQTLFQGGGDHDVTFDVMIMSAKQLKIIEPRYGPQ